MKPRCMHCDEKPARALNLPGFYAGAVYYCSLRCAAMDGLTGPMARCDVWCDKHSRWTGDGECYDCYKDRRDQIDNATA